MDYLVETFKAVAECDITTQQKLSSQQFFSGIFQTQRESNYSKWSLKVMVGCHWQLTLFFVIHLLLQLELSFSATRGQILLEGERGFSSVSTLNCVLMLPTRELFAKLFHYILLAFVIFLLFWANSSLFLVFMFESLLYLDFL